MSQTKKTNEQIDFIAKLLDCRTNLITAIGNAEKALAIVNKALEEEAVKGMGVGE